MSAATPDRIDAATVRSWLQRPHPVTLIDVRSSAEFETVRIPGSVNVPLPPVERHAGQLAERLHREVVLVCQSGVRAGQARQRLAGVGAQHLHVLDGGVAAFAAAGGTIVRSRARWSLEPQVRMVAGSAVLAEVAASVRVPAARLLAGGIGAGLTISALTDTCTMGRLLAALPYNRGPRARTPAGTLDQLGEQQAA